MNSKAAGDHNRMKLNRRGFLGGALATVALPAAAIDATVTAFAMPVTKNVTKVMHESTFGWIDPETDAITNTISEIVTTTLRNPRTRALMVANVADNNAILSRLQARLKAKDAKKTFRFDKMHDNYEDDIAANRRRITEYIRSYRPSWRSYANQGKIA